MVFIYWKIIFLNAINFNWFNFNSIKFDSISSSLKSKPFKLNLFDKKNKNKLMQLTLTQSHSLK